MKKSRTLGLGALLFALSACSQLNPVQEAIDASPIESSTKVVKLSDEFLTDSFLVKLGDNSSLADLDQFSAIGEIAPLFPSNPARAELEKQFGLDRWYEVRIKDGVSLEDAILKAASFECVALAEYNNVSTKCSDAVCYPAEAATKAESPIFNDPLLPDQWHYQNTGSALYSKTAYAGADVNVSRVWKELTCGDPSIIVAVVDEGVKYSHPDLKDNMWVNTAEIPGNGIDDDGNGYIDDVYGYNFVDGGNISWSKQNDSGHGTHCAGTIAAVNNNGIGVSGVAGGSGKNDGCRIMSCQIFSDNRGGNSAVVSKAVKYAADMGASIISCSFGFSVPFSSDNAYIRNQGSAEIDAIHYFEAAAGNNPVIKDGNIAIFAAGNESHNFAHYPGAFYDIISVSAFGPDFLPTNYTNYGPGCNISAPGGEMGQVASFTSMVLSTVPNELEEKYDAFSKTGFDYGYMQGTSMACPHVSGVTALALSYAKKVGKSFTRDQFKQLIMASTNDIDSRISSVKSKSYVNVPVNISYVYKAHADIQMAPFYHQMGTGAIDAWRLMMHIEGTNSLTAATGKKQWIDLSGEFGSSSTSLTYLAVEVPQSTVDALGLQELTPSKTSGVNGTPVPETKCYAYEQFGRLYIHPTKVGSGKISIRVVGGGDHLGGGDNPPGGYEVNREVSIIARQGGGGNGTGGWL